MRHAEATLQAGHRVVIATRKPLRLTRFGMTTVREGSAARRKSRTLKRRPLPLLKRIATAVVLIPIVLVLVLRAPVPVLAVVAAVVALLTIHEFLKLTESYGVQPMRLADLHLLRDCSLSRWQSNAGRRQASSFDRKFLVTAGICRGHRAFHFLDSRDARRRTCAADIRRRRLRSLRSPISLCPWGCWCNCGSSGRERFICCICCWWFGREISLPTSWAARSDAI